MSSYRPHDHILLRLFTLELSPLTTSILMWNLYSDTSLGPLPRFFLRPLTRYHPRTFPGYVSVTSFLLLPLLSKLFTLHLTDRFTSWIPTKIHRTKSQTCLYHGKYLRALSPLSRLVSFSTIGFSNWNTFLNTIQSTYWELRIVTFVLEVII